MDAQEYDRIADLLCQIRSKVRNNVQTTTKRGKFTVDHYCNAVEELLHMTDKLAKVDEKGWL